MRHQLRISAGAAALLAFGTATAELPAGAIRQPAAAMNWQPAPASLPKGFEIAVLEGNPQHPGLFTMRLRAPAGTRLAPHTHPKPERVTVIAGSIGVAFGAVFQQTGLTVFRAGDFYVNPPGVAHFVSFPEDAVVQITGDGPWRADPVEAPK